MDNKNVYDYSCLPWKILNLILEIAKNMANHVVATLILIEIHNRPMGRTANDVS